MSVNSFEKSVQRQETDYNNKKIYTRFYMLDKNNQIKVLEEIKNIVLFKNQESSIYILEEKDVDDNDIKYIKKLKK